MDFGIDPEKLHCERSTLDNLLKLPIELGSVPKKFVPLSISD